MSVEELGCKEDNIIYAKLLWVFFCFGYIIITISMSMLVIRVIPELLNMIFIITIINILLFIISSYSMLKKKITIYMD